MSVARISTITAFHAWTFSYYAAFSGDARSLRRIFRTAAADEKLGKMAVASRYKGALFVNCLNGQLRHFAGFIAAIRYTEKILSAGPDSGSNASDFIAV